MMGKYQKYKILTPKNKIQKNIYNQSRNSDKQLTCENNKIIKKLILKLRNKFKYTLLTFFNSKK